MVKKVLSKEMALQYIYNEFGNVNLKVTTELTDDSIWTGKVILEETDETPRDDEELAKFYSKTIVKK